MSKPGVDPCPFHLFDPGLIESGVDFLGRLVTWPHDRLRAIRSPLVGSFTRAERLSVYECERCAVVVAGRLATAQHDDRGGAKRHRKKTRIVQNRHL